MDKKHMLFKNTLFGPVILTGPVPTPKSVTPVRTPTSKGWERSLFPVSRQTHRAR